MIEAHIFDYGPCRTMRLYSAFQALGINVRVSKSVQEIKKARAIILPDADMEPDSMALSFRPQVLESLQNHICKNRPLLALGSSLLLLSKGGRNAQKKLQGLSFFEGTAERFDPHLVDIDGAPLHRPHLGFSLVLGLDRCPLFAETIDATGKGEWFHFCHEWYLPVRMKNAEIAVAHHGLPFAGGIWRDNVLALQFLPELSGLGGLKLLASWCKQI